MICTRHVALLWCTFRCFLVRRCRLAFHLLMIFLGRGMKVLPVDGAWVHCPYHCITGAPRLSRLLSTWVSRNDSHGCPVASSSFPLVRFSSQVLLETSKTRVLLQVDTIVDPISLATDSPAAHQSRYGLTSRPSTPHGRLPVRAPLPKRPPTAHPRRTMPAAAAARRRGATTNAAGERRRHHPSTRTLWASRCSKRTPSPRPRGWSRS